MSHPTSAGERVKTNRIARVHDFCLTIIHSLCVFLISFHSFVPHPAGVKRVKTNRTVHMEDFCLHYSQFVCVLISFHSFVCVDEELSVVMVR